MLNILVAYPYFDKGIEAALLGFQERNKGKLRFLLDSGAFTAFTTGRVITVDEYCSFLDSLTIKPWRYFTLDVIGNENLTMRNYETMVERGYNPVPIFTSGQSLDVIDEYYKTSDFIGIGGLVGVPKNKMLNEVTRALDRVNGRKAHLLGYTSIEGIKHFRPYSCDSSSWSAGARYGRVSLYMGNGRMSSLTKADFKNGPTIKVLEICDKLKVDYKVTRKDDGWKGQWSFLWELGAASWVTASVDFEKYINTKLFLAPNTKDSTRILVGAYERMYRRLSL